MTPGELGSEAHKHFSYFITKTSANKHEDCQKVFSAENTFKNTLKKQVMIILLQIPALKE